MYVALERLSFKLFNDTHSYSTVANFSRFISTIFNIIPVKIMFASAAYKMNLDNLSMKGRSLINIINNSGPKMLSWGIRYCTRAMSIDIHILLSIFEIGFEPVQHTYMASDTVML